MAVAETEPVIPVSPICHVSPLSTEPVGTVMTSVVHAADVSCEATGVPWTVAAPVGFRPAIETLTFSPEASASTTVFVADGALAVRPLRDAVVNCPARSVAIVWSVSLDVAMWCAVKLSALIDHVSPAVIEPVSVTVALENDSGVEPSPCVAVVVRVIVFAEETSCIRPFSTWPVPVRAKPAGSEIWRMTWPLPFVVAEYVYGEPSSPPRCCATCSRPSPDCAVYFTSLRLPMPSVHTSPACTVPVSWSVTLE